MEGQLCSSPPWPKASEAGRKGATDAKVIGSGWFVVLLLLFSQAIAVSSMWLLPTEGDLSLPHSPPCNPLCTKRMRGPQTEAIAARRV